jgi:type IV pilus assembly protein PilY1
MKAIKIIFIIFILLKFCLLQSSFADDTDLYMASGEGVEPNILIMFDNSGSMNDEVQTRFYSDGTTYDPLVVPIANRDTVYRKQGNNFTFFAASIDAVACSFARTALRNTGHYSGGTTSTCGGTSRTLWTGNYRNYIASGGDQYETKLYIAKQVITDFLNAINGVRLGAMVFNAPAGGTNNSEGGHIQTTIKSLTDTGRAELISDINAIVATTWTPLAETLYESGLYFKGGASYFNSGVTYVSPIEYSCQRNYVIVITDGLSTQDRNSILATAIGDRDGDQREPIGAPHDPHYADNGSDYLDDVAKYLYDTDLRSDLSGQQNIITYTIGFTTDNDLLERTATHGHGKYFYSQDAQSLSSAFQNIVDEILAKTSSFVAPVVPVNRMERTTSGDKLYLALFKPIQNSMWSGNIKKYGIAQEYSVDRTIKPGDIIDTNNQLALDSSGQFFETAHSYWTSSSILDGGDAEKGGVGEVLMNRDFTDFDPDNDKPRKIYTYLGSNINLTNSTNRFNTTNITPAMLGLGTDTSARDKLVKFVYGYDAYDDDGNGITNERRDWILGAFLHSRPLVIHYSTTQSVIFAGSNDGMLHAFDDASGEELWGFIPPNLFNKLQALHEDVLESFVDGSPKAYISRNADDSINQAILIFGERRGGNRYYALDVTNPSAPKFLWGINPDATDSPYAEMGQSWSTPYIGKIAYSAGVKWVVFIGGGYDVNQDNDIPAADTKGRAIYIVDVLDGSLIKRFSNIEIPTMTYSIPSDISRVDTNDNEKIDRLYVGDMSGQIWRFDIGNSDPTTWSYRKLFTGSTGTKIFYPPDVTLEWDESSRQGYEMLFIGTGDREHPKETDMVNRLYALKDKNDGRTLTENDLVDVTSDELQDPSTTSTRKLEILSELKSKDGWYIRLEHSGEKSLSSAAVINQVAFYTTFTPGAGAEGDPCHVGEGVGRIYALQYQTGNAVFNYDLGNDETDKIVIKKEDRIKTIGMGIPSGVVITFINGQAVGYIGIGGGVSGREIPTSYNESKSWKIIF